MPACLTWRLTGLVATEAAIVTIKPGLGALAIGRGLGDM